MKQTFQVALDIQYEMTEGCFLFSFCGFQKAKIIAVTESLIEMNPLSVRSAEHHSMDETLTISMAVVITKPSDGP